MGRGQYNAAALEEIAARVTEAVVKKIRDDERERQKKNMLHNTELLLRHYNSFNDYLHNAIDSISDIDDRLKESVEDELYLMSIKKSKFKTLIMIAHIDSAVDFFKRQMIGKGLENRYQVIKGLYFDKKTFEQLAEELKTTPMSIRRWKNEAIDELSVPLFGIDGLKLSI